jgi:hypothetical protein
MAMHDLIAAWKHFQLRSCQANTFTYLFLAVLAVSVIAGCEREKDDERRSHSSERPFLDVLKKDCQKLVAGQLVFVPATTMRQGNGYMVSARLSRGADALITRGLDGKGIVIEKTLVSCMVSMNLDSQEQDAFKIENMPAGRKDEQILLANTFSQWDWRVTPLKSGTLHLLLYVTPMIYVNNVGESVKHFPQPARVITVSPDYVFAVKSFVLSNWAVWGSILTAIIIPAFVWMLRKINKRREEKHEKELAAHKEIGF